MTLISYYQSVVFPTILVLFLGGFFLLVLRKRSAATRQFVCSSTLFATLAVGLIPFLPTRVRPIAPPSFPTMYSIIPESATKAIANVPATIAVNYPSTFRFDFLFPVSLILMAVSMTLGLRLIGSLRSAARLRKRAQPASEMICQLTNHPVQIVSGLSSPVALGGFKPMILLPAEAEHWSEEQLRAVLLHEEAHLDNHDPDWQILAEVVCIAYWFNPLVWLMRQSMRNAAERAADDAVICSGITPSAYAEDLFEIATSIRRNQSSIAWTTFARKNGVKGRIRAILNTNTVRTPMKKPIKVTSVVGLALAAYLTSAYTGQGQAFPKSHYKDIREGRTISAESSNGFMGRLADAREVEVVQISRQLQNGSIVAWKPDGTVLEPSKIFKFHYHPLKTLDTHTRYILLKFPDVKGGTEPNAGCGSADQNPNPQPSEMVFAGGGNVAHKDGFCYTVSYIGLPHEDSEKFSAGFSVSDSVYTDRGVVDISNPVFKSASITEVNAPLAGDTGHDLWWSTRKGSATMVEYVVPADSPEDIPESRLMPIFFDPAKSHKEIEELGCYGDYVQNPPTYRIEGFKGRYYFRYPKSMIKEFHYQTRTSQHCNILNLAASPNGGKP